MKIPRTFFHLARCGADLALARCGAGLALVLCAASPLLGQQYGATVAIDGDRILVGAPVDQESPAVVRIYGHGDDGWAQMGTMGAPAHDGPDYFGRFVTLDGMSLLAGGTVFENGTGAVWAFRRDGGGWQFDRVVRPEGVGPNDSFGRFGGLFGDRLFVSSLAFGGTGAVWLFERDGSGAWVEKAMIRPDEPTQLFGWGLDYDGERLLVGGLVDPQTRPGAAWVFAESDTGEWTEEARLGLPEDMARPLDGTGPAGDVGVAWFHGMALLGLPGRDEGQGVVYAFRRQARTGSWAPELTLTAFDREPGASFGHEFAREDEALWVAAPAAHGTGAIYRFVWDGDAGRFSGVSRLSPGIDPDTGDGFGRALAVSGDLAVVGQPGDDGGLGSVIVLRDAGDGWIPEAKLFVPPEPGLEAIAGADVPCASGKADQFDCSRVDIRSFLPVAAIGGGRGVETNDVWGWTDPETGREYALVGRTDGTSFVDISDPNRPVYLGNLPKTPGSITNAWRDIKVYADHAYIVADGAGPHGMQVFDLTRLRDVTDPPATFDADVVYDGIASAHNIVINEASGTAYVVGANSGGDTCGGGLHMIDIREPERPTFLGCFQDTDTGRAGTGYSHDAMCIDYDGPDEAYRGHEICFGANETALSIADVTDKEHPVKVSSASYPNVGYTHQGWITEDHRYFYLDDELDEMNAVNGQAPPMSATRTLIWDVTDLDDPILVKEHAGATFTIDHNLYIVGDLMYQSNYVSGLRILDIRDRENPREVGFLDTVPWDESVTFDGSWSNYPFFRSGTIVVTSGKEGVFFLRYRPAELVP